MTEGNYFNVGHRGPVYKGLGAMNPCDLSILSIHIDGVFLDQLKDVSVPAEICCTEWVNAAAVI
jgi:hypothetical protein